MQQAHDKVWKVGLRIKLQRSGVTGCMYQWISQYLTKRKARVHVDKTYNCNKTLREESLREVSWALPYSLSSPKTLSETCLVKSREPYTPTTWSCGAQRNTLQLQAIDFSSCWTSWKVEQNGGLLESTPGRPPMLFHPFRRPICISMVRLCLLKTTLPTWQWLLTNGWLGNNKVRKLKPEPRCALPSWRSWQARHLVQMLWL